MRWLLAMVVAGCSYHPPPAPEIDAAAVAAPDAPPADQRCLMRYGGIDSYDLCASTETSCTFYAHTNDGDCLTACGAVGGTCVESRDGDCSDSDHDIRPCTETHGDQVCICSN